MEQSHNAVRSGRTASVRAAQTMMESYGALVSGVLIGMSEGIGRAASGSPAGQRAAQK